VLFLANFILKGQSQAALVAATMAILGLILPPAAWISAAAIVLITLVNGPQRGLITTAIALMGTALFAYLIFATPQVAIVFVLLVWLPAWLLATVLRQTVSLAYSLQVLAVVCLLAIVLIYTLYPDFGEFWRESLDQIVMQLAGQSEDFSLAELKQTEDWVISFLPGLFISSLMFGTILSLLLGRWWQAVNFNPGGFAEEFQSLNLGKVSALVAVALIILAMLIDNIFAVALVTVMFVLYGMQALSILHAVIRIRQLNGAWLFAFYMIMFFVPHLLMLLILLSLADPWLDIRQRLSLKDRT
jgi:hypothetical protein